MAARANTHRPGAMSSSDRPSHACTSDTKWPIDKVICTKHSYFNHRYIAQTSCAIMNQDTCFDATWQLIAMFGVLQLVLAPLPSKRGSAVEP